MKQLYSLTKKVGFKAKFQEKYFLLAIGICMKYGFRIANCFLATILGCSS
jgi:hypothetical protein